MLIGKRDLGLVVLLVFVVIGFIIRRKWLNAAARSEEVNRLLLFASEEAATAEIEASSEGYFYTNSSPPVPVRSPKPPFQCAVCFSPTNTRCAKCKAVRYWYAFLFNTFIYALHITLCSLIYIITYYNTNLNTFVNINEGLT